MAETQIPRKCRKSGPWAARAPNPAPIKNQDGENQAFSVSIRRTSQQAPSQPEVTMLKNFTKILRQTLFGWLATRAGRYRAT